MFIWKACNYAYAHFIASSIVFSGTNYSDWYIADYPKQATRMKKIVREGSCGNGDIATRPIQLARSLCEDIEAIEVLWLGDFKGIGAFDLDKAIKDIENLLKK